MMLLGVFGRDILLESTEDRSENMNRIIIPILLFLILCTSCQQKHPVEQNVNNDINTTPNGNIVFDETILDEDTEENNSDSNKNLKQGNDKDQPDIINHNDQKEAPNGTVTKAIEISRSYYNKQYNYYIDIPLIWENNYEVVIVDNRTTVYCFICSDTNVEMFTVIAWTKEEIAELLETDRSFTKEDILASNEEYAFTMVVPIDFGAPLEIQKQCGEEYYKLLLPHNILQSLFRLKGLDQDTIHTEEPEIVVEMIEPEINLLELSDQERVMYDNFRLDYKETHLAGLQPISICKLYLHAMVIEDYETQYEFYIQHEKYLGWTKERHLKDIEDYRNSSFISEERKEEIAEWNRELFRRAENIQVIYYHNHNSGLDEAVIKFISRIDEVIGTEHEEFPYNFILVKNQNGIWKVRFKPMS